MSRRAAVHTACAVFVLALALAACKGSDKEAPDSPTDSDPDSDASPPDDTDPDTDTDPDSGEDSGDDTAEDTGYEVTAYSDDAIRYTFTPATISVVGAGLIRGGGATFDGEIVYYSTLGEDTLCDATISLTGTAYTGDCYGCDYAFDVAATLTDDSSAEDCALSPYLSYVENSRLRDLKLIYTDLYVLDDGTELSYGLGLGYALDLSEVGGAYYPGPYFDWVLFDDPGGDVEVSRSGSTLSWSYYDYGGYYEKNTYHYCEGVTASTATAAYGGLTVEGRVDCISQFTDGWTVEARAGETLWVSADTVADSTAADLVLLINGPDDCTLVEADDNFDCTYAPTDYACPSASLPITTDGEYRIWVWSWGHCQGDVADYQLAVDLH